MPGGDGSGPLGMGPMTGGGFGYCVGPLGPGSGRGLGRGFGRGRRAGGGRGFGFRRWAMPPIPPAESELDALRRMADLHEEALGDIRRRLEEIGSARPAGSGE